MSPSDVIIVGAPRSGTNMLRDVLERLDGFTTWPCDEINAIWRHGNTAHPSDELRPEHARPEVTSFIRRQFDRLRGNDPSVRVVEKTCATSLRVEFTRAVKPDSQYVFITRDGVDAAVSAMERWHAPFDFRYTAAKARFVPMTDIPRYAGRVIQRSVRRGRGQVAGVTTWWGPRPDDFRDLMASRQLDEIAAIQWSRCVDSSLRGLAGLGPDQLHHVSYEEFVAEPRQELRRLLDFLGAAEAYDERAVSGVRAGSVGKGRGALGPDALRRVEAAAGATLERLGYAD
ncbi:sulfotransferase family protein [Nocardioides sp. GCM10027113]|uniref:sulfotransferase family protein n=1 Tax=unclassified Nocardioides TaxID=2615069 RepID=UPI00360C1E0D